MIYLEVGQKIEITEGSRKGLRGTVSNQFKTTFGKQFLDVDIDDPRDDSLEYSVRVRRSDVKVL